MALLKCYNMASIPSNYKAKTSTFMLFIYSSNCRVSASWPRVWVAFRQVSQAVGCQCRRQYGPSTWGNPGSPACWPWWSSCWGGHPARGQDLRATSVRWRRHWGGSRCTCDGTNCMLYIPLNVTVKTCLVNKRNTIRYLIQAVWRIYASVNYHWIR